MRALIVYFKGQEATAVKSGNASTLRKELNNLKTLPKDVTEAQLWTRDSGVVSRFSETKVKNRAAARAAKATAKKAKPAAKKAVAKPKE